MCPKEVTGPDLRPEANLLETLAWVDYFYDVGLWSTDSPTRIAPKTVVTWKKRPAYCFFVLT